MTVETAIWACCNQISKELEASVRGFSVIISDRSPVDTFAYALYFNLDMKLLEDLGAYAIEWMKTYDEIYFVRPDTDHTPFNDGIRSTDMEFILGVDVHLENLVDFQNWPIKQLTTKEIFYGSKISKPTL
jgi:hypothetical protein